ncbi:MAG: hypothetical protein ACK6DZ_18495, partial [Acidobacteriota bacterium]
RGLPAGRSVLPVKRCALKIFLPHPQAHAKALGQPLQAHFAFLLGAKKLGSQIVGIGLRQLLFRAIATAVMLCQDLL